MKITVTEWSENINGFLSKFSVSPFRNNILEDSKVSESIRNGFGKCGHFPFDTNVVNYSKNAFKIKLTTYIRIKVEKGRNFPEKI